LASPPGSHTDTLRGFIVAALTPAAPAPAPEGAFLQKAVTSRCTKTAQENSISRDGTEPVMKAVEITHLRHTQHKQWQLQWGSGIVANREQTMI
jgi:hypothetical protein